MDRGSDASGRVRGARERPRARDNGLALALVMSHGESVRHKIAGKEERHLHAQWIKHQLLNGGLVAVAGDRFDHATGNVESRVVIRPDFS